MSTKLKLYLSRKILECIPNDKNEALQSIIHNLIELNPKSNGIELNLSISTLKNHLDTSKNIDNILKVKPDEIIKNVQINSKKQNISFEIDKSIFVKDVIEHSAEPDVNFNPSNIVVEYSSPNVAKPFHLGHLRSTIIGNFISNLNKFSNNKVVRLNYLGNWGTQFGFIKVGVDELKLNSDIIKQNPLKHLYESYVYANKLYETDSKVLDRAKLEFKKLENGDENDRKYWNEFMGYTRAELDATYSRLGVQFDEYNYESMYNAKEVQDVLNQLRAKKVSEIDKEGKEVAKVGDRNVTIVKSDGSTLYLTRDIAAAVDRYNRFKFDKMLYIVENGQSDHFVALKELLHKLDYKWAQELHHVKFGRIKGMSTRKGQVVFLKDILDQCKEIMIQRQIQSPTTKVPVNDEISDILAVSCVIINDLKKRRLKDYSFDWNSVLEVKGDTGIKLQYTHCRLHSLEQNSGAKLPTQINSDLLVNEPELFLLLKELAQFQRAVSLANVQLEACVLVNYLLQLCNLISKTLKIVKVKGMPEDVASQRLLVFHAAKKVLYNGMCILGLRPKNPKI